ncbi:MgPP2C2, protein phosphatase 2C protein 2 [Neohortaea acidophila]|uniref:MgPP2C2, protein phosphatase 2C protein 2 n=1 Tax=Neohortaea acidophila TaxID=245834 RepID=A0A6A6PZS0_9PEZI|nr:MgPP2C2, protein phosphatase 2C protein 2 [Neohortaea acidophila]KAF2485525.1 MgPP2C2, protein phosphatase 2C protein 2 [Neohortaea acidophila]
MAAKHIGPAFSIPRALSTIFPDSLASNALRSPAISLLQRRQFHEYFVTHLPSSSLAPDRNRGTVNHKLPRSESQPHSPSDSSSRSAASIPQHPSRDTTIVRIPIKSAKHHFGAGVSRGSRPYNEDRYQAGTIELPAFAKRQPISISKRPGGQQRDKVSQDEADQQQGATSDIGDPQVFYFSVFDGHGGSECSEFLRDRLHGYIEEAALLFGMRSTLQKGEDGKGKTLADESENGAAAEQDAEELQRSVVNSWKETVGGYFKRFRPEYFPALTPSKSGDEGLQDNKAEDKLASNSIETVLTYAFLKADLDFTTAQAQKHTATESSSRSTGTQHSLDDPVLADRPINDNDLLYHPDRPASQNLHKTAQRTLSHSPDLTAPIGGSTRFKGGSTASIALISTPTPTPFWHPASPSTLMTAHVGDTRILLCRTSDGKAVPLTTNHHPSAPIESTRLRRYSGAFVTDSFGEERVLGLANTRAFGDISSKRIGVSAEPQLTRVELPAAGYSFLVLVSDGVSGHLEDQEIVDVVKEAKTPKQAADELVKFAVEVSESGDNATALVVRLGGWERRSEGGVGSMGTKEQRDYRREEAMDPRGRRM